LPVAAEISLREVIAEDEDDIGLFCGQDGRAEDGEEEAKTEKLKHKRQDGNATRSGDLAGKRA
jgi:hypothetical protein